MPRISGAFKGAELRIHDRASIRLPVTFSCNEISYTGVIRDISLGGMFVATLMLLSPGSEVDLEFALPGSDEALHIHAQVCWIREYSPVGNAHPGMGFRFVDPEEAVRAKIDQYVQGQ